jgi:DNA-binding CsgD family transcriptional regulator
MPGDVEIEFVDADYLLVDGRGKVLFVNESASLLAGRDPAEVVGDSCWLLTGLRRRDGTPFCGPTCPIRDGLEAGGSPKRLRLLREQGPGRFQKVDVLVFLVPSTSGSTPVILHLIAPVATEARDVRVDRPVNSQAKHVQSGSLSSADDEPSEWPRDLARAAEQASIGGQVGSLTIREREVLQLLAEGHNTKRIAERLFISPVTVKHHVQNIMMKLGVHRRIEAILAWIRQCSPRAERRRADRAGRNDPPVGMARSGGP